MEGSAVKSNDDEQGQDTPTVLWEKCIQQSIIVDLSEDESLHFSDLEASFALHVSQAESAASEASIHVSGSTELSALDDTSSECSISSSQSDKAGERKNASLLHVIAQRLTTMKDKPLIVQGYEDPGHNTSDEDHEDLPYDGDLGSCYFNHTFNSEGTVSSEGRETVHGSPDAPEFTTQDKEAVEPLGFGGTNADTPKILSQNYNNINPDNCCYTSKPDDVVPSCPRLPDGDQHCQFKHLLLRHFSQEELLCSGRLIEAETLPEVSLVDSMDDTIFSCAPLCTSTEIIRNHTESSEINHSFCNAHGRGTDEDNDTISEISKSQDDLGEKINDTGSAAYSDTLSSFSADAKQSSGNNSAVEVLKLKQAKQESPAQNVALVRTRSFTEMKYGQGQVHYPLPDFSKVASKVKIPKAPSCLARPVAQSSRSVTRTQSSPGMLDLVSRILEDSIQSSEPYVFKDQDKEIAAAMDHRLQAEYDSLLSKYPDAENLMAQVGNKTEHSEMRYMRCDDHRNLGEGSHLGSLGHHAPSKKYSAKMDTNIQRNIKEPNSASSSQSDQKGPSDGDRMTAELRDFIEQFMQKVEELKLSVSDVSVSTAEQQVILRSMMEAQDQLERNYISKKEEHRALEMQNYMGLSRNTGTFDPDRLLEGDIFRIGMHLEDIKEVIDKNACDHISKPLSSSAPTPTTESPCVMSSTFYLPTPSSPPSMHEPQMIYPSLMFQDLRAPSSTVHYEMEKGENITEETSEDSKHVGLEQSNMLVNPETGLNYSGQNSCNLRGSQGSLEGLDTFPANDEDVSDKESQSVWSEEIVHNDNLTHPNVASAPLRQRQQIPESRFISQVTALSPEGECVSVAVKVSSSSKAPQGPKIQSVSDPFHNPLSLSQTTVMPETDSGFESTYLRQPAVGPFLFTKSGQPQNYALSSSDSEGSYSNLQTAIQISTMTSQKRTSPQTTVQTQSCEAATAVELWVESTTKQPSVRLQGPDPILPAQLHHNLSEPILSTTMDAVQRQSHLYPCSCHSETILALQLEVCRLKKNLAESLIQLPHLSQKMDYLTAKFRQDRRERRSKTRNRIHHRSTSNSATLAGMEDWISSDMDHSKSKGPQRSDTSCSEIMLQLYSPPGGGRRSSGTLCCSEPESFDNLQRSLNSGRGHILSCVSMTTAAVDNFYSKETRLLPSSPSLQNSLLQLYCGSPCSLSASFKAKEPLLQSASHQQRRCTKLNTTLLPGSVDVQGTQSPGSVACKAGRRTGRHSQKCKEEELNRTLDRAIEMAHSLKRATDCMVMRLSADLDRTKVPKKPHNMQPLVGRKNHTV
ncbi:uncharacterized protein LOC117521258 [Thalassophryne amazonica]|uniref:uncharacterized protein LOC117521258 n=1 Tax=Thalassophryne amazonica TaxID=390379 RepID=UPI0014720A0B|nr:uncharacterized protein LOC117521258 [Thalassophryne amazonica]